MSSRRPPARLRVESLEGRAMLTNIVFIGNSYTDLGDPRTRVPALVADIAVAAGQSAPATTYYAPGGATLGQHATYFASPSNLRSLVPNGQAADVVVIQGQSQQAADDSSGSLLYADFRQGARSLASQVRAVWPNARIVLYETQARPSFDSNYYPADYSGPSAMQADIDQGYSAALADIRATHGPRAADIAPAGDAWGRLGFAHALYRPGDNHPSARGALLSALTIYSAIYRDNVRDISPGAAAALIGRQGLTATEWDQYLRAADGAVGAEQAGQDARFVAQAFVDVLRRTARAADLNVWLPLLADGSLSRFQVVSALQSSDEYRAGVVTRSFQTYLRRAPTSAEAGAFLGAIRAGAGPDEVALALVKSDEYILLNTPTPDAYVSALYRDLLGRPVDTGGLSHWKARLSTEGLSIAGEILNSVEGRHRQVRQLYDRLLKRPADPVALGTFGTALRGGLRPVTLEAILAGSAEYYARFA